MSRRHQHEMDEWADLRTPWYVKFWRIFFIWGITVTAVIMIASIWRIVELNGSHPEECRGMVKSIEGLPRVSEDPNSSIVHASILVNGRAVDILIDKARYPNLKAGDTLDLLCRRGRSGTLFVQNWHPASGY